MSEAAAQKDQERREAEAAWILAQARSGSRLSAEAVAMLRSKGSLMTPEDQERHGIAPARRSGNLRRAWRAMWRFIKSPSFYF